MASTRRFSIRGFDINLSSSGEGFIAFIYAGFKLEKIIPLCETEEDAKSAVDTYLEGKTFSEEERALARAFATNVS